MTVTVRQCQRCSKDHNDLVFKELDNAVDEWKWWALCPTTGQPILLAINNGSEQPKKGD